MKFLKRKESYSFWATLKIRTGNLCIDGEKEKDKGAGFLPGKKR